MVDDTFKRILQDNQFHLQIKAEQKAIIQNVNYDYSNVSWEMIYIYKQTNKYF
jgi:hypothetical protein